MIPKVLAIDLNLEDAQHSPVPLELWEGWFQTWLSILDPQLSSHDAYEVSLRLTDDANIQAFNAKYRGQDRPTDVLAFAVLEAEGPAPPEPPEPLYLGDLLISVETAQRQATEAGQSLAWELAWLAAHGLLHLLGWDHPDEVHLAQMLAQQERLLQAISLSPSVSSTH